MVVVWFRIEAIAVALARGGDNICQGCWLIPHFNATLSRLNLKVTFCGGVKLWKRASPDIFVLHLGAKHHLCHYITAHNGFTDEQHKILPAEICRFPLHLFFWYSRPNGISCKINRNFDVPNPPTFITPTQDTLTQVRSNKAHVMSNAKNSLCFGSTVGAYLHFVIYY